MLRGSKDEESERKERMKKKGMREGAMERV